MPPPNGAIAITNVTCTDVVSGARQINLTVVTKAVTDLRWDNGATAFDATF